MTAFHFAAVILFRSSMSRCAFCTASMVIIGVVM